MREVEKVKYVAVVAQVEHDLKFFSTEHQINSKVQQDTNEDRDAPKVSKVIKEKLPFDLFSNHTSKMRFMLGNSMKPNSTSF